MPIGTIYKAPDLGRLNESVAWDQLDRATRDAFDGVGEKVLLQPGFRLYKFTKYDLKNRAGKITEWWSPLRSFKWDAGLQARINSTNVQELMREIRRASAVRDHWNDMTHILTADLLKPVYGFFGKIGWQPRWTDVTIEHMTSFEGVLKDIAKRNPTQEAQREAQRARFTYGGGASQIFIDKLTDAHIKRRDKVSLNDVISGRATVL